MLQTEAYPELSQTLKAASHLCCYKKVFWKYAANLQKNAHTEVSFQ